jgi:hypothetical protein
VKDRDLVSVSACGFPVFPAAFVEEDVFSPSCVLGSFVEDQLVIDVWVYLWIFYYDPLVFLSFCVNTMLFKKLL